MQTRHIKDHYKPIEIWLYTVATLVFCMIVLGGYTRLTNSGLSMVEWKPFMGFLPPLSESQWWDVFFKYQSHSEYKEINHGMALSDFKSIFLVEYFHRLLGRVIAITFVVPLLFFISKKRVDNQQIRPLIAIFALICIQGALGWYMVTSGLADQPQVSQYRLVAHLGLAVTLYGFIISFLCRYKMSPENRQNNSANKVMPLALLVSIFIMILSGGLVAGTHAGLMWNTFPLMGNTLLPPGLFGMVPGWLSAFEDPTTIQFNHRAMALIILVLALIYFVRNRSSICASEKKNYLLLLFMLSLVGQISLGILTLLLYVPIWSAVLHQANAIILLTLAVLLVYSSGNSILFKKETL